mmetsp:Transcript_10628/g.19158  ORF Transcript_10628/g.19158 Transcript_10628/m.19158 type:complete len:181 (-) Transcript_10628:1784-2326(-)
MEKNGGNVGVDMDVETIDEVEPSIADSMYVNEVGVQKGTAQSNVIHEEISPIENENATESNSNHVSHVNHSNSSDNLSLPSILQPGISPKTHVYAAHSSRTTKSSCSFSSKLNSNAFFSSILSFYTSVLIVILVLLNAILLTLSILQTNWPHSPIMFTMSIGLTLSYIWFMSELNKSKLD